MPPPQPRPRPGRNRCSRSCSRPGLLTPAHPRPRFLRQLFERSGSTLMLTDAGELNEGEEDVMAAPREAEPDDLMEADSDGEAV